jgi:hypothetical protein
MTVVTANDLKRRGPARADQVGVEYFIHGGASLWSLGSKQPEDNLRGHPLAPT